MKTLDDLFMHFLQDIYYAERQILKALPRMTKNAKDPDLMSNRVQSRPPFASNSDPSDVSGRSLST